MGPQNLVGSAGTMVGPVTGTLNRNHLLEGLANRVQMGARLRKPESGNRRRLPASERTGKLLGMESGYRGYRYGTMSLQL